MKTYTKINTLYKRYQFSGDNCPKKKWLKFKNKIIFGAYVDETFEYLKNNLFEAYSKIDGTNSKICYYPSTQQIIVGGKTDNAQGEYKQFENLEKIAQRILPKLKEIYPIDSAKFSPKTDENDKVIVSEEGKVTMEEVPVYIYGEYYGNKVGKVGKAYSNTENYFTVFDICQQGWWIPSAMRHDICRQLELDEVPFYGIITLDEAEDKVHNGFTTLVKNTSDPTLFEEGLVLRPVTPIKNSRGKRIIVKVKFVDYHQFDIVRNEFTDEEFLEFNKWYFTEIEPSSEDYAKYIGIYKC